MPEFEPQVFISYAHLDNLPLSEAHPGWVTDFHRALQTLVSQRLGKESRVWRDPKLQGNDVFAGEIATQLVKAAVLVSVLSPRYVKSDWCLRELRDFLQAAARTGGATIGSKARVFKVVKTPVPLDSNPPEMRPLIGYDFFTKDPDTGRPREFDRIYGADAATEFWLRINDLAYDVAEMLEALETGAPVAQPARTVFLAQTTSDLQQEYDAIRRELRGHGYLVLPDTELPLVVSELERYLREQLVQSRMSVHLIGSRYGVVPEGSDRSVAALQWQIARDQTRADFLSVLWMPPNLRPDDPRQVQFLEAVRNDPAATNRSDILETSLGELKTYLLDCLDRGVAAPTGVVYLICHENDVSSVLPLRDRLIASNIDVLLTAFEGDATELAEDHRENLRTCARVVVYYGAGNEVWLRRQLRDINTADAARTNAFQERIICVAPPPTSAKTTLQVRGYTQAVPETLERLLDARR